MSNPEATNINIGKLILRLAIGGLLIFHGIWKIRNGYGYVNQMLADNGLPEFLAYGVLIGEVLAPLLILLGVATRIGAVIVAVNMAFAIFLSHSTDFISIKATTGGLSPELDYLYLLGAVTIALIGAGSYSLYNGPNKWLK